MKIEECEFDKDGFCHALACFSSKKCNARDKNGNPKYVDIEKPIKGWDIKREY